MDPNNQQQDVAPQTDQVTASGATPPIDQPAPQAVTPVSNPGQGSKKRLVILLTLLILVIGGAAAYAFVFNKDKSSDAVSTNQSADTSQQQFAVPDEWYIADNTAKVVTFYDTNATKVRELPLNLDENYHLNISSVGQNSNIQVVDGGRRIFAHAGRVDPASLNQMGDPVFETYEIFEIVDNEPVQVYSAPDNETIRDWVVSHDGEKLYIKVGRRSEEKVNDAAYSVVDVSTREVKRLNGFAEDAGGMATGIYIAPDKSRGGYFYGRGGQFRHVSDDLTTGERTVKDYTGLQCGTVTAIFCSPEWPEAISPNGKYVVYGYQESDRFGVSILDVETGEMVSNYQLDSGIESIGSVFWAPDSSKISLDTDPFSNEGQRKVGLLNRVLELKVGENTVSDPIFSQASPGLGDAGLSDAFTKAFVSNYGYSVSGQYLLVHNDDKQKIIRLSDNSVQATIEGRQPDSTKAMRWVR